MGFEDKALAIAAMIVTVNAVLLVGFGAVGIDFSNDNLFTWIDSAVLEKGELAAQTSFNNPNAVDLNQPITFPGITAEETGSSTISISFLQAAVNAALSVISSISGILFGYLYVLEFLKVPVEIQFIIGVPLSAITGFGFFYLIRGLVAAITGALK